MNKRYMFASPFVVFMLVFVVLPLLLLLVRAFWDGGFTLEYFKDFFTNTGNLKVLWRSIWVAFVCAAAGLLIAYPIAYALATSSSKKSAIILMLFILPMWVNTLLRTFALRSLMGLLEIPLGYFAIILGIVLDYLPFMILPIYVVLSNVNKKYSEASSDLGANGFKTFLKVTLPLSIPGIISGFLLVFTPAVSTYFFSHYLGNSQTIMFGELLNLLYANEQFAQGAVLAIVLLSIIALSIALTNKFTKIGNKRGGLW